MSNDHNRARAQDSEPESEPGGPIAGEETIAGEDLIINDPAAGEESEAS